MKTLCKSLVVLAFFASCSANQIGTQEEFKTHLDSEIEQRLQLLKSDSALKNTNVAIFALHQKLKGWANSINLYDAAVKTAARADSSFASQCEVAGIGKNKFISLSSLGSKADIVIGIKLNELILLDYLLLNNTSN